LSAEVDLIVVQNHELAEQIVNAHKHAGIAGVEFWPEHMLRPANAYSGALLGRGGARAPQVPDEQFGPFHIRVPEEWLHEANVALLNNGLARS
jgi:hypothetical protein